MKRFCIRAAMVTMLITSSVAVSAAPEKPPKPTKPAPPPKPQPPTDPTPGGDFVQCVNDGNSVQTCLAMFGG